MENLNYSDIKPILDNVRTSYNDFTNPVKNPNKLKPALLTDIIKLVKDKDVYLSVDVKTNSEKDLIDTIDLFRKFKMEDRVMFGSFRYFDFNKLRAKYNYHNITFFGGRWQCKSVVIGCLLGLLPFINTECDVFALPFYFESIPNITDFPKVNNKFLFTIIKWIFNNSFKLMVRHL